MKNYLILTLFAWVLFSFHLYGEKHGLVIAIGDYPAEGEWPDISSTNDVVHITSSYKLLGFEDKNIRVITDDEASYQNILSSFEELLEDVQKGDVVFIHYSGHGQQVIDDNGDEIDGLDEAIVPFDSPLNFKKGVYEGERLIRDDLIGKFSYRIRKKLGVNGQLVLVMDSCHSGTGTRGGGRARGTDKIMAPNNYEPAYDKKESNMGVVIEDDNIAPMASFFGASSRELNYETVDDQYKAVGSLSYAFASILANMSDSYSFKEIFERIKLKMKSIAPSQNPQWEGPEDVYLLGESFDQKELLFDIKEVISDMEVVGQIGTISEVFEGSIVELYSLDREEVIATGEVSASYLTECDIELFEPVSIRDEELVKIRIIEKATSAVRCAIENRVKKSSEWNETIEALLDGSIATISEQGGDLYLLEENGLLTLSTADGYQLFAKSFNPNRSKRYAYQMDKIIKAFTQGKYIRAYDVSHSQLNLSLSILKVDCEDQSKILKEIDDDELIIGSCIQLKVENQGAKPAYFSVLDIQPDNVINVIIPAAYLGFTSEEYYLEPGKTFTTDYSIEVGEPAGSEVLKLIASDEALDLGAIMSSKGASTRGSRHNHPFENIFAATYQSADTRGVTVKKPSVEQVGTDTKYFRIVKK